MSRDSMDIFIICFVTSVFIVGLLAFIDYNVIRHEWKRAVKCFRRRRYLNMISPIAFMLSGVALYSSIWYFVINIAIALFYKRLP